MVAMVVTCFVSKSLLEGDRADPSDRPEYSLISYGEGSAEVPCPLPAAIRRLSAFMYALAEATMMSVSDPRPM